MSDIIKTSDPVIQWLLAGEPWVVWRTKRMLLGEDTLSPQVNAAHQAIIGHPKFKTVMAELAYWPLPLLNSHKSAKHPLHLLSFLVDIGLQADDPGMPALIANILSHQSQQGPFQVLMNISPHFGGSGEDTYAWALCDAPLLLYSLVKLGMGDDERVQAALSHLLGLLRDNGWPCAVSPELGSWRGPGRKDDPCPYATLLMLKLLAELPQSQAIEAAQIGTESLLTLWTQSHDRHPYLFYMGDDFRKLKAPLVWYDILHVTDVLSRFAWLRTDPRLIDMVQIMSKKSNELGFYTPTSVYQVWKDWDFGQKKLPSKYLTLRVLEIISRMQSNGKTIKSR